MANTNVLFTICEIFSLIEVENHHLHVLYSDCILLAEESVAIYRVVHVLGYSFVTDNTGLSSFV